MNEERTGARERSALGAFVALNLLLKLALIPLNRAEYTDGILQLTVFENRAGLYPPLYGALARALSWTGLNLEWSGRAVSAVAGALAVVPIYWMARRAGGEPAARFAALLFTISPLALRWSPRVMTDSLFLLLSAACLHLAAEAWGAASTGRDGRRDVRRADRLLAASMAAAVLAALTRYQGVFLLLPVALAAAVILRESRRLPWRTGLTALLWAALPLWTAFGGFAHGGQFADRTVSGPWRTALDWWSTAESFVLIAPYYFGYPVAAFALVGLFFAAREAFAEPADGLPESESSSDTNERRQRARAFLALHGIWAVAILAIQSAFLSFQYRYMLPVLPAALVLAGTGAARLEDLARGRGQRLAFSAAVLLSVLYLTFLSCAVLVLQRGTFGDQRAAADWAAANVPPGVPIYSNERYGPFWRLGSVKMSFWTGRQVKLLGAPETPEETLSSKPPELPPGAVLILSNAYGGNERLAADFADLNRRYRLRPLTPDPFTAEVVPLMDDVMTDPLNNQNPLGWVLRYAPQSFQTRVFRVEAAAPR